MCGWKRARHKYPCWWLRGRRTDTVCVEISHREEERSEEGTSLMETQKNSLFWAYAFRLKSASSLFILVWQRQVKKTKQTNNGKHSITNFFGTLRPSLVEAEPHDAEIFAVEDELRRVELQLLVGTQHFPFPLCIIHWAKQTPILRKPLLFLLEARLQMNDIFHIAN